MNLQARFSSTLQYSVLKTNYNLQNIQEEEAKKKIIGQKKTKKLYPEFKKVCRYSALFLLYTVFTITTLLEEKKGLTNYS